ncbi:MAG TPA: acyl carrier protein [Nevskiaceae bacterium]|nr:acyl carrier protein [Nevskiaceae bacterium]
MPSQQEILEHLRGVLVDLFEINPALITMEARLYEELDIDSIDAIDLVLKLKDYTGRKIQPEEFKHVRTVQDVVTAVEALFARDPV